MVMVKATSSCGVESDSSDRFAAEMHRYNEALARAGILVAVEKLHPGSEGIHVRFYGGKTVVNDGPYAETKELLGGYWMWKVRSKQEALDWIGRCPMPEGATIEIRQVVDSDDASARLTRSKPGQEA